VVDAVEVVRDFLTQEAAREGMILVAPQIDRSTRLAIDGDNEATGVRAIVRTDRLHNCQLSTHLSPIRRVTRPRTVSRNEIFNNRSNSLWKSETMCFHRGRVTVYDSVVKCG
jgi:hypothetical protein